MEMMELKVNPLPAKTWHWVRMNDSDLKIELPDETPHIELRGRGEELKWQREGLERRLRYADEKTGSGKAGQGPESLTGDIDWKNMETGMGEEFAALLDDTKSFSLDIPDDYVSDEAAVICVDAPNGSAAGQILIHAGKRSQIPLVVAIRHKATGDISASEECSASEAGVSGGSDTVALQLRFYAEEGARLSLYVAQMLPLKGMSCLNIGGVCEDRAQAELVDVSLGSLNEYVGIAVKLKGEESGFCADMGYRVRSSQRLDINYIARHTGTNSLSRMNAWGVMEEKAFKLFRGTIDFARGCPGSKGMEKEDVLLLGEDQVNQTIPLILCHEEDVEGDHGATISRLDDQILFYLGSRGIDPKTAENMIARARIEALINRIPDEEIRSQAGLMTGSSENGISEGAVLP